MSRYELPREKRVKHLTLIREPRSVSSRELDALPFADRLQIVRMAPAAERYELLLKVDDSAELVEQLSPQDTYLTLKALPEEAVVDMMSIITPAQLDTCLDLDTWAGDTFSENEARNWLERLAACEEGRILELCQRMNFEILVLILNRALTILHGPEVHDDEDARYEAMRRDGGYEIVYRNEQDAKLFGSILGTLFRLDPGFHAYLMEAVRSELPSMLEESVYAQRAGRLADLGFPEPHAAKEVFAWYDPEMVMSAPQSPKRPAGIPGDDVIPTFMLPTAGALSLLAELLAKGLSTDECWELAALANKLLMADGIDLGSADEVASTLDLLYASINIALEYSCGENIDAARRMLEQHYAEHLFRAGYSLQLSLQKRARDIAGTVIGPYLDEVSQARMKALTGRHPRMFEDDAGDGRERLFAGMEDVNRTATWLDGLEVQHTLFAEHFPFELVDPDDVDLAGCTLGSSGELSLAHIFLTALANRVLGRDFVPQPIPVADLEPLHREVASQGRVDRAFRRETVAWLEGLTEGGGSFAESSLDLLEEEFCAVSRENLDPRFLDGLIIRLPG